MSVGYALVSENPTKELTKLSKPSSLWRVIKKNNPLLLRNTRKDDAIKNSLHQKEIIVLSQKSVFCLLLKEDS